MSWKEVYESKLTTADEALNLIKSGDRVVIQHACGEPSYLVSEMVRKAEQYENVEIVHMVSMGKAEYCAPGMEKHFRHNALFVGGSTRKAVEEGRADFTPCFFSDVPKFFTDGTLPVDVVLMQSAPPEDGKLSFGISVDYTYPAAKAAKHIIVQINKNMPYTYGQSQIDVSEVDAIVEHDEPLIELPPAKIGDVELAIGKNCASLVQDGDTLQLGIGAIPDAVLSCLKDKKDLGIHSEMFSDGVVELAEAGVITNKKKKINTGKYIANFLMGTKRLYDFVDHNKNVEMYPANYVNNPVVVMQEDNIVCINSCVQMDMMGQVCSESVGLRQISGTGGQVDFIRGADMAKNGRAILAFPSTAAKGTVSKIVPLLDEGAAVTTCRCDVDYAVTEFGIAKLKGRTLRQRAKALIAIAHPNFREGLKAEYEKRFRCKFED